MGPQQSSSSRPEPQGQNVINKDPWLFNMALI